MTALPLSTSRTREVVRHDLKLRSLTVTAVQRLTEHLTRVTLAGDDLADFSSVGPEDHVKILFPAPPGERIARDYTPAVHRADTGELDLDFVLHGDSGPASAWASGAQVGDTLNIGGPRGSRLAPNGYRRIVLLADESAVPALSRWIVATRDVSEVIAFVQSDDPAILDYPFPNGDRVAVTAIGVGSEAALVALGGLHLDEDTYIWAAGEATALIPVRRHLRRELGLAASQVKVDGYWKFGTAELDHHAPLDPDDPED
ncbi:siderophore-interacting protein [Naasia lichenicola]|uniref:Siderophore-interacting protein n=1 Tax=Naasia lichenicola TaxID=2565933 RepID=A0A4S4FP39_9MICO|nr:siderophore-interacting protein [Naasia lichenicola]THG32340.1 siderophore-interacting protein [Naasia lichenicola]